tara:strand:- start:35 stop:316 length:282 start_codon:yes stop_codon:yes gene_type:complete
MKKRTRKGGFIKKPLTEDTKVYKVVGVYKEAFDSYSYDKVVEASDAMWLVRVKGLENAKKLADERAGIVLDKKEIKCFVIADDSNRAIYRTEG